MMKARGTYLVPTLMAPDYLRQKLDAGVYFPPKIAAKARDAIASIQSMFKRALAKGVKIGLGTDAAVYPHGLNAGEFHLMVDLGMNPWTRSRQELPPTRSCSDWTTDRLAGSRQRWPTLLPYG